MKFLVILSVALACVAADVSHLEATALIKKADYASSPDGSYAYSYETGNGILAQEQGALRNVNNENPSIAVQGGFRYPSPNGPVVELTYTADENGFHPQGAHLPVAPEIPAAIIRAIEYTRTHPSKN